MKNKRVQNSHYIIICEREKGKFCYEKHYLHNLKKKSLTIIQHYQRESHLIPITYPKLNKHHPSTEKLCKFHNHTNYTSNFLIRVGHHCTGALSQED